MSPPLVLVPGLLCDERLFAPQLPALLARTSVQIAETRLDPSLAAMASRLLAEAPPRFALAGLSMGGYVCFEVMRRAPERVIKLALLATQARADTAEAAQRRRELMALAERGEFEGVAPRLLPLFVHPDHLDRLAPLVTAMAAAVGKDAFLHQQQAIMARPDSSALLPEIACPTLVLCGRQDQLTPVGLHEEMAAAIPEATLVVLPRCGHLVTLERPESVTAQLLAWLEAPAAESGRGGR
ncbi:MAG: alpha/beta hydrolase [Geminicoccaceae bacterium]|nr:alpha/beta hydrolase [Geminicoccaceae bacterium]